ncbi:hypothetical protein DOTSEDRAFT_40641 [Dothistroma septosporum NZE10]|uniref:UmuC domain-containing protein n=1 Tax=Dothistroma septosporum (strain NZE10 / CBS 128990) TaxID=675120 RepID=N1Q406_DOTSN|nr:hypothetical protein DOTSEDRAFT_40641 [Dothistroma septosporum NZE10]
MEGSKIPARHDGRIIIHFDYDCFYASVFEAKRPELKSLPFAVQQKQIIVTCNYEARRRGLHKLQLIREAKRVCPDVVIELGEDLSRFRDASKELYSFVKSFSWNNKIERLGFDEIWMDTTDIVDYNISILNKNDLQHCFFQTSKDDLTAGFSFDATALAGHPYPANCVEDSFDESLDDLALRLKLGSHLALHIRHQLEEVKGYTSTVGIATTKLLSKLVGNLNKPKGQTTMMPPFETMDERQGNVTAFMDSYEIGQVPGIGFKIAQRLRSFYKNKDVRSDFANGSVKERVSVSQLRNHPDVSPDRLEKLLAGPGSAHGIGSKIWCLLHGVDDSEVSCARPVPTQISIEDSYIRLDTTPDLLRAMTALARSLITRMRIDLMASTDEFEAADHTSEDDEHSTDDAKPAPSTANKRWLAYPKTLRLSTRPRLPLQPDGTRERSFKRTSTSASLPSFMFNLNDNVDALAEKLVKEALTAMFKKLHPERAGWNLSLVNLAVTSMAEAAGNSKTANGRDISSMFRRQESVLKNFKVTDISPPPPTKPTTAQQRPKKRVRFDETLTVMHIQAFEDSLPVRKAAKIAKNPEPVPDPTAEEAVFAVQEVDEPQNVLPGATEDGADTGWEYTGWINEDGEDDFEEVCPVCGLRLMEFEMIVHKKLHQQTRASEDELVPD